MNKELGTYITIIIIIVIIIFKKKKIFKAVLDSWQN